MSHGNCIANRLQTYFTIFVFDRIFCAKKYIENSLYFRIKNDYNLNNFHANLLRMRKYFANAELEKFAFYNTTCTGNSQCGFPVSPWTICITSNFRAPISIRRVCGCSQTFCCEIKKFANNFLPPKNLLPS